MTDFSKGVIQWQWEMFFGVPGSVFTASVVFLVGSSYGSCCGRSGACWSHLSRAENTRLTSQLGFGHEASWENNVSMHLFACECLPCVFNVQSVAAFHVLQHANRQFIYWAVKRMFSLWLVFSNAVTVKVFQSKLTTTHLGFRDLPAILLYHPHCYAALLGPGVDDCNSFWKCYSRLWMLMTHGAELCLLRPHL